MTTFETVAESGPSALVCHCRRVPFAAVEAAVAEGRARTLADIQRQTTACTRCFGCRFELERLLEEHLGDDYVRTAIVTSPAGGPGSGVLTGTRYGIGRRMYMPILRGYRGYDVRTRVIVFNWSDDAGEPRDVSVRADLLALDGTRRHVWRTTVGHRRSAVIDIDNTVEADALPDGVGVMKLVLDSEEVGSLRPYFHLITPTSVTSTHEKKGLRDAGSPGEPRKYFWTFPVARSPFREEAYFFATNSRTEPIADRELVWRNTAGQESRAALPVIGLDQSACVPLHEHFPAIADGTEAGSVRLSPSIHVAGFILRHDPERELWRVQHL